MEEIQSDVEIKDKNALGFHIPGMWDKILDIKKCHLQADPSNAIRLEVKEFVSKEQDYFLQSKKATWYASYLDDSYFLHG